MRDRHRGAAMVHGDLPLDGHVADRPPPTRHALLEHEALEMHVPGRVNRARSPLVHAQRDAALASDENSVEGGKPEHPLAGRLRGDHEQAVIAPGPQPADSAHGIAAESICDQPLTLGRGIEVAADLRPKPHGTTLMANVSRSRTPGRGP